MSMEAVKLSVMVRIRRELVEAFPGGSFLPPTIVDNRATVGFKVGSKTWLAEAEDFLAAYHSLHKQVVG